MRPLVDKALFDRVNEFIERGQKGQGKLLTGRGRVAKGYVVPGARTKASTLTVIIFRATSSSQLYLWPSIPHQKSTVKRSSAPSASSSPSKWKRS
jgi:hypothetical protein